MSQEMNYVILPGGMDAHEYVQFDRKPNDPELVPDLQIFCACLLFQAVLTRAGCSEEKLELSLKLTVDGAEYTDRDPAALYRGIKALANAEAFSIDVCYRGRIGGLCLWSAADAEGNDYCEMRIGCPEAFAYGMTHYMDRYRDTEQFTCKTIEYLYNHDALSAFKVVNGVYADIFAEPADESLKAEPLDWMCSQFILGVDFDTDTYAEAAEALRDAVRRHLPEDELRSVEDIWAERAEEGEHCVDLLNSSFWSDLPAIDAFFAEVNAIIREIPNAEIWCDSDKWCAMNAFAVAKLVIDENGLHIEANRF